MEQQPLYGLVAEFESPTALVRAANKAREAGYSKMDAYSPIPIEELHRALGLKDTKLPWVVLGGGLTGALAGNGLQYWASTITYPFNIGGRSRREAAEMKWWTGSFFWRTLAVLVIALVASQAASFWLFRQQVQQPRMMMGIGQFVSHLKTIHAALTSLPPGAEREFLERLAEKEGIRVHPALGDEPGRPAPERPGMRMFRERIKGLFGPETEVYVRPGMPGVLWVRLRAGERGYWVGFPRNRVERDNTDALVWWMLAGASIAILATALIAWRLNRPLARAGEQRAACEHLREAQAEDLAAQCPQLAGAHFEADQEQEQHEPDFRDVQDRLRFVEHREPDRADQQAGTEVAEHCAEAEPAEERHANHRGRQ